MTQPDPPTDYEKRQGAFARRWALVAEQKKLVVEQLAPKLATLRVAVVSGLVGAAISGVLIHFTGYPPLLIAVFAAGIWVLLVAIHEPIQRVEDENPGTPGAEGRDR